MWFLYTDVIFYVTCTVSNNGFIVVVPRFRVHFPLSEVGLYFIYKSFLELTVLPKLNVMGTLNTLQTSDN